MSKPYRVAVVGSRAFPRLMEVKAFVHELAERMRANGESIEVVSGGAPGVDIVAQTAARDEGLGVKVFAADWNRLGKAAGMIRNQEIVDYADEVVAFWDGSSPGTKDTINRANWARKPLTIRR